MFERPRVFCASLADWLDDEVPIEWLTDLLMMIHDTPNLDWLLLSKRPENFYRVLEAINLDNDGREFNGVPFKLRWPMNNVWIGVSVEDQQQADKRIPELLKIPANVRFLSCEPLLGPLNLEMALEQFQPLNPDLSRKPSPIQWCIVGGESGPAARPMHPDWARSLRDQCVAAGVAFHFKQWGQWRPMSQTPDGEIDRPCRKRVKTVIIDQKGTLISSFPPGAMTCLNVGKNISGRLLDGHHWSQFPKRI